MGAKFDRDKWLDWHTYYKNAEQLKIATKKAKENDDLMWNIMDENVELNLSLILDNDAPEWIDEALYGKYEGPVIVCGAGPSLLHNIASIKEKFDEGCPVIACDRSFKILKANGIKPMLTVTVDPSRKVANFYEGIEKDDVVALSLSSNIKTSCKVVNSRLLWFAPMHPTSSFWGLQYTNIGKKIATVRPGGVVGYSAVDIAIWCGFDMICSIGNDFSWQYYDFDETIFYVKGGFNIINLVEKKRLTIEPFLSASRTFGLFPYWHPEVTFIDSSGGIIEGWEKQQFYSDSKEVGNGVNTNAC